MLEALQQNLKGGHGNYMLPFFWQHGEDEATLRHYMQVIYDANIRAVCIEARPHPDFAGPGWWHDLDIIMDEARTRGMQVWVLDDAHFPTGYANGAVKTAEDALCKQYLYTERIDIGGPMPAAQLDIAAILQYAPSLMDMNPFDRSEKRVFTDEKLVSVIACAVQDNKIGEMLDITGQVRDGALIWDVPAGMWRVYVCYLTRNGGGRSDYINMLDKASCRLQIDAVYEPHYARYKADFGKTFAGFFSDEPCVGNTAGFTNDDAIGRKLMRLPWSGEMEPLLLGKLGPNYACVLPLLWQDAADAALAAQVRYAYMDSATHLISENFCGQIGRWCEAHGVQYIGHIIEDNNQHARLGSSQGHFFRAMRYQHMSGIDCIRDQVTIAGEYNSRPSSFGPEQDGEFFHYALGKLGASLAHIDPRKQGRAMCEIFGASGWATGVRAMKAMADHFLVRGINHFVPHAFSPKAFPDPDCPPHFYAQGENPQYHAFGELMTYMNRVCNLFQAGKHIAPIALLYHAEAEWAGDSMLLQKPVRALMDNQLDFDILPADVFVERDAFGMQFDGKLHVNGETFEALVIPYAQFLPASVLAFAREASDAGFPVLFVDALPEGASDDAQSIDLPNAMTVPLGQLAQALRGLSIADVTLDAPFPLLRTYHYARAGVHAYMLSNEDSGSAFDGIITLSAEGVVTVYDAAENSVYPLESETTGGKTQVHVKLPPLASIILVLADLGANPREPLPESLSLAEGWRLSFSPGFANPVSLNTLTSLTPPSPDFAGHVRYETSFTLPEGARFPRLDIANAYETPTVWLNGVEIGTRLAPPYTFDLSQAIRPGVNALRIDLTTTLHRRLRAQGVKPMFHTKKFYMDEPMGIIGDVIIHYRKGEKE